MTADAIASALGGKKIGSRWMAPCLSHDDSKPSLSNSERGGKLLVHCFPANCHRCSAGPRAVGRQAAGPHYR